MTTLPLSPINDFCAIHGFEPIPASGYYKICGECWHVYLTAEDLIEADQAARAMPNEPMPADEIIICPLCTHDF